MGWAEMERLPQGYGGIRLDPTIEAISSGRYGAICVDSDHTVDAPELPSDLPEEDILLLPLSVCSSILPTPCLLLVLRLHAASLGCLLLVMRLHAASLGRLKRPNSLNTSRCDNLIKHATTS